MKGVKVEEGAEEVGGGGGGGGGVDGLELEVEGEGLGELIGEE